MSADRGAGVPDLLTIRPDFTTFANSYSATQGNSSVTDIPKNLSHLQHGVLVWVPPDSQLFDLVLAVTEDLSAGNIGHASFHLSLSCAASWTASSTCSTRQRFTSKKPPPWNGCARVQRCYPHSQMSAPSPPFPAAFYLSAQANSALRRFRACGVVSTRSLPAPALYLHVGSRVCQSGVSHSDLLVCCPELQRKHIPLVSRSFQFLHVNLRHQRSTRTYRELACADFFHGCSTVCMPSVLHLRQSERQTRLELPHLQALDMRPERLLSIADDENERVKCNPPVKHNSLSGKGAFGCHSVRSNILGGAAPPLLSNACLLALDLRTEEECINVHQTEWLNI
eukprot:766655-Hanusia_phi.AAC.6